MVAVAFKRLTTERQRPQAVMLCEKKKNSFTVTSSCGQLFRKPQTGFLQLSDSYITVIGWPGCYCINTVADKDSLSLSPAHTKEMVCRKRKIWLSIIHKQQALEKEQRKQLSMPLEKRQETDEEKNQQRMWSISRHDCSRYLFLVLNKHVMSADQSGADKVLWLCPVSEHFSTLREPPQSRPALFAEKKAIRRSARD